MNASTPAMREFLIALGEKNFEDSEIGKSKFAGHDAANALLNDLENMPHAFVLGCVMDLQIKAEKAWVIPYKISELLGGTFSMAALKKCSIEQLQSWFREHSLHRYNDIMGERFHRAVDRIATDYGGNAANIWSDNPRSETVVRRFREFHGVGQKISTMAANILVRHFRVPMADYCAIDISSDVHIERVMPRMGLVPADAEKDIIKGVVISKAREMHPKFPGIFDLACWKIGRDFCHPKNPNCENCPARKPCPKII